MNLRCFWSAFLSFSLTACASEKSGFDMVFTVFAAHSHVRKLMKHMKKCGQNSRCTLGLAEARFWAPFWRVLGSLWEALGRHFRKKGGPERDRKNDAKNGSASNLGKAPVRPYKPSFLEPSGSFVGHSWPKMVVL